MSKLGYTWYPKDWWSSDTFYELFEQPVLRLAYREILDLLYVENNHAKITQKITQMRFGLNLNETQWQNLENLFDIDENGFWSSEKVRKRANKAETARKNGANGGRPRKTQKPSTETQDQNPKNPPLEGEREYKGKEKGKEKVNNALRDTQNSILKIGDVHLLPSISDKVRGLTYPPATEDPEVVCKYLIREFSSTWENSVLAIHKNLSEKYISQSLLQFVQKHWLEDFESGANRKAILNKKGTSILSHFQNWLPKNLPETTEEKSRNSASNIPFVKINAA